MKASHSRLIDRESKETGFVLISFFLIALVLLVGVGAFYAFGYADIRASMRNAWQHQALYVAEAGLDRKIFELVSGNSANITGGGGFRFFNQGNYLGLYDVFYGVVRNNQGPGSCPSGNICAVNPNDGSARNLSQYQYANGDEIVISTGTVTTSGLQDAQKELRATLRRTSLMNPRAAVTISGVTSTTGNVTVDGRDHDINGNLTGQPGVFGISTSSNQFSQTGNSQVGGNGIAPTRPADPNTYELNGPAVAQTPEVVLGLAEGALDAFKTSTPPQGSFSGIVYLTTSWNQADLNGSSGVLIVHNSTGDAALKNVSGTFKGLIITDDMIHINSNAKLIGALVGLKSDGVTLGNGNADVLYSSQTIAGLPLAHFTVTSWEDRQND